MVTLTQLDSKPKGVFEQVLLCAMIFKILAILEDMIATPGNDRICGRFIYKKKRKERERL